MIGRWMGVALLALLPGMALAEALFEGAADARWLPFESNGGNFAEFARYDGGALVVEVPEGKDYGTTGIVSAAPMVPRPAPGRVVRLRWSLDGAGASNALLSLLPAGTAGEHDWSVHDLRLVQRVPAEGTAELFVLIRREERGRVALPAPLDEIWLELLPGGVVQVAEPSGRVLIETLLPQDLPEGGWHLYAVTEAIRRNLPAHLRLRGIASETAPVPLPGDPDRLVLDVPETVALFGSGWIGPRFMRFVTRGGDFALDTRQAPGRLEIDPASGTGAGQLGLVSPEPVIWLDGLTGDAEVRLEVSLDPALSTGFVLGLAPHMGLNGNRLGRPAFVLDWNQRAEGGPVARQWRDTESDPAALVAHPAALPGQVALVLSPGQVRVEAEGFPGDAVDWPYAADGQGLRLYLYSQPMREGAPARLAVTRITLARRPGQMAPAALLPAPGIADLPETVLFDGVPGGGMLPIGLGGADFGTFARYEDGALVVALPKKYQWSRTGLMSDQPVAVLDERLAFAPYRLRFRFDPLRTDNFRILLSTSRREDMWDKRALEATMVRETEGAHAGDYRVTLGHGHYGYWTRWIPAERLAMLWDGEVTLLLAGDRAELALSDALRLSGGGFPMGEGYALYMTLTSLSAQPYGPAAMALERISGGWASPPGMDAATRLRMVDDGAFDVDAFLDIAGAGLGEGL